MCELKRLYISDNFAFSNKKQGNDVMKIKYMYHMFHGCEELEEIVSVTKESLK